MSNNKFHKSRKKRYRDNDSDENLRGRLREKEKLIRSLQSRVRQLEKHLSLKETIFEEEDEEVSSAPAAHCDKCDSVDLKLVSVFKPPSGEIKFLVCQECFAQKKVT